MNKSQLPRIAKAILKKLNESESKSVCINVYGNEYEVYEYNEISECERNNIAVWQYTTMDFDYSSTPLPTQKDIEDALYRCFIEVK